MAVQGHFDVPVRTEPKDQPDEHGTEIIIRRLRRPHHETLSRQQSKIRQTLGDVYSYLLAERGFTLDRRRASREAEATLRLGREPATSSATASGSPP